MAFPFSSNIPEHIRKRFESLNKLGATSLSGTSWCRVVSGVIDKYSGGGQTYLFMMPNVSIGLEGSTSAQQQQEAMIPYKIWPYNSKNLPYAGLKSVSSKYKGLYGGTREITINWHCENRAQFEKLMPFFATPGRMIFVDWGGSNGIRHMINPGAVIWNLPSNKLYDVYKALYDSILRASKECEGQYDGVFGVVTNFNWTFNEDYSYSVTTKLMSVGTLMHNIDQNNEMKEESDDKWVSLTEYLEKQLDPYLLRIKNGEIPSNYSSEVYTDKETDPKKAQNGSAEGIFVSWRLFEKILNDRVNSKPPFLIDSCKKDVAIKIPNHRDLLSSDLSICIIPNKGSTSINNSANYMPNDTIRNFIEPPEGGEYDQSDVIAPGYVGNIMINTQLIKSSFKNTKNVTNAIINIFNEVSKAASGFWNFHVIVNPEYQFLQVVDINFQDHKDTQKLISELYDFNPYVPGSFISSIDLSGDMPNEVAVTTLYAQTKSDNDFTTKNFLTDAFTTIWNDSQYADYFMYNLESKIIKEPVKSQSSGSLDTGAKTEEKTNDADKDLKALAESDSNKSYSDYLKNCYLPHYDEGQKPGKEVSTMLTNIKKTTPGNGGTNNILTPLEIKITIPGVGGFAIGNCFKCLAVPTRYYQYGYFMITAVDDEISTEGWSTTLTGKLRLIGENKGDPKPVITTSSTKSKLVEDNITAQVELGKVKIPNESSKNSKSDNDLKKEADEVMKSDSGNYDSFWMQSTYTKGTQSWPYADQSTRYIYRVSLLKTMSNTLYNSGRQNRKKLVQRVYNETSYKNMKKNIEKYLNPLFDFIEANKGSKSLKLNITSGIRDPHKNFENTPGSSPTSQHMQGNAFDFSFGNNLANNIKLYNLIIKFLETKRLSAAQVLFERRWNASSNLWSYWVHTDWRQNKNERKFLQNDKPLFDIGSQYKQLTVDQLTKNGVT